MHVRIIDIDQRTGAEALLSECDLSECFEAGDEELIDARAALERDGAYLTGGGAAPLCRLERIAS